jgi:hypothetical protein
VPITDVIYYGFVCFGYYIQESFGKADTQERRISAYADDVIRLYNLTGFPETPIGFGLGPTMRLYVASVGIDLKNIILGTVRGY